MEETCGRVGVIVGVACEVKLDSAIDSCLIDAMARELIPEPLRGLLEAGCDCLELSDKSTSEVSHRSFDFLSSFFWLLDWDKVELELELELDVVLLLLSADWNAVKENSSVSWLTELIGAGPLLVLVAELNGSQS